VLGRRIDQAAGTDLVTGDGRDVDEVFCAFMYGSAAAITLAFYLAVPITLAMAALGRPDGKRIPPRLRLSSDR
jgi:hypothetical protein